MKTWIALSSLALAVGTVAAPKAASAQSCHCQHEAGSTNDGVEVRGFFVGGGHAETRKHFVGLGIDSTLTMSWFQAQVTFAGYRLERDQTPSYGPGDVTFGLRVVVFRTAEEPWTLAVGLRGMAPTSSPARGFGMGHLMLGPEVRVTKNFGAHDVFATVNYLHDVPGTSIGSHNHADTGHVETVHEDHSGHAHHFAHAGTHSATSSPRVWPDVDPHNMSELAAMLGASFGLGHGLSARVSSLALVPLGVTNGLARLAVIPGIAWATGPVQLSLDVEATVLGGPWFFRGFLAARYRIPL